MSLTSILRRKEMKELFAKYFEKPRGRVASELKAPPRTNHFGLVGTAFDYLLRFYLKQHFPKKTKEQTWVAEAACKILKMRYRMLKKFPAKEKEEDLASTQLRLQIYSEVNKTAEKIIAFSKNSYKRFLKSGYLGKNILKSSLLLAQLDPYLRAGVIDENLGKIDEQDIEDLRNLISLVVLERDFRVDSYCLLNPFFGRGSAIVFGADVDLVIDDEMVDIKTTRIPYIRRDDFNQIIGYYILACIDCIEVGKKKIGAEKIKKIGFYFARYGIKHMYSVEELIGDKVPNFIEEFKQKLGFDELSWQIFRGKAPVDPSFNIRRIR